MGEQTKLYEVLPVRATEPDDYRIHVTADDPERADAIALMEAMGDPHPNPDGFETLLLMRAAVAAAGLSQSDLLMAEVDPVRIRAMFDLTRVILRAKIQHEQATKKPNRN